MCEGGPRNCADSEGGEPCDRCWAWRVDALSNPNSPGGGLLLRTLDWDFALDKRMAVTMADIPADEWMAMKIIDEERRAFQAEQEMLKPRV